MDSAAPLSDGIDVTGHTVEIRVGPEHHSFSVHHALLTKTSEFFKTALRKEWTEGQKRVVNLPDDDSDAVYTYIQWLYRDEIFAHLGDGDDEREYGHVQLAKLYVLGEKLVDDTFQDRVMDCMVMRYRADGDEYFFAPSTATINIIYDGTPWSSPARQFLVDLYASSGVSSWIKTGRDGRVWEANGEFKDDLLKEALDKLGNLSDVVRVGVGIERGAACVYHKHDWGDPCSDEGEME